MKSSLIIDMYWKCSLCNIELPDDELIEVRKRRHADFHIDESVGTGKPKRNWTFGNAKFELVRIIESL